MPLRTGVLIDVVALKGVDMLPDTYEITVDDLQKALDPEHFMATNPGDRHRGCAVARGTRSHAAGRGQPRRSRSPNPDPQLPSPLHQIMLVDGTGSSSWQRAEQARMENIQAK